MHMCEKSHTRARAHSPHKFTLSRLASRTFDTRQHRAQAGAARGAFSGRFAPLLRAEDAHEALGRQLAERAARVARRLRADERAARCADTLVARIDIPAGTPLEPAMLACKRPGTGIPPNELDRVLGKSPKVAISAEQLLTWDMF